jgi:hypothetical protein
LRTKQTVREGQKGRPNNTLVADLQQSCLQQATGRGTKSVYKYWNSSWPSPSCSQKPAPLAPPSQSPSTSDLPRRSGGGGATGRTRSGLVFSPPSLCAYTTSVQSHRGRCRRRRRHCTSAAQVSCRPGDLSSSSISSLGGSLGVRGPRSGRILGV